jgi:hypothetical protein
MISECINEDAIIYFDYISNRNLDIGNFYF